MARYQHVVPDSLSSIVRSMKAAATRLVRTELKCGDDPMWLRSFYDIIILDPHARRNIERYIRLNPLLWYLDYENPHRHEGPIEILREELGDRLGLDTDSLDYLMKYESDYRKWRDRQLEELRSQEPDSMMVK
jgi:hypothetical protein